MTEFILTLAAVFITAGILLLVANHLGFPSVPFYIIAGLITGAIVSPDELLDLALWGIAFLVFVFGTEVDIGDVQLVIRDGEGAAFTQLIIVAPISFVSGYLLAEFIGIADPFRNALYFSAAATLSSTLVGSHILEAEIRKNLVYGRLASSVHFFDDIVAIGALLVLSAEVLTDIQLLTSKIGFGFLFLVAGLLIYRHGYPLLIRATGGGDELMLMGSISILIAFLAAAEYVGISIVVGAFAAGIAVRGEGGGSLGVRNGIRSIRDFFAAIFFVTVGALVTIPTIEVLLFAGILILLVTVINPTILSTAFIMEGYDGRTGILAGSSLNQVSELAIVIAIQAFLIGTISPTLFDAIILAAAVTMILSAVAGRYEQRVYELLLSPVIADRTDFIDDHSSVNEQLSDHVVIIGYGRLCRQLTQTLAELDVSYVVIENDPALQQDLSDCQNHVFGDAMASYPLELARVGEARLIISPVDHQPVSASLLRIDTDADRILRASSSQVGMELLTDGATFVIVPSVMASHQLSTLVERVLADEVELEQIQATHRDYMRLLELAGLQRRLGQL